jgi:AraC-like DNA-binding protein
MNKHVPAITAIQMINQKLMHQLWPFDDELAHADRHRRELGYAYHAVKQMWVLQHSTVLPCAAALPLIQALKSTLEGLSLPPELHAWMTLIDAQQSLLTGDQVHATHTLGNLLRHDGLSADVRAATMCVGFHAAMLQASPLHAPGEVWPAPPRVETLSHALTGVRQWRDGWGDVFETCSPKAQAQLIRIGGIMDALDGRDLDRPAWLRMAADMAAPEPSIARAYSQLACGWVFLAEGRVHRATVAFDAALGTSHTLGWSLGSWLAAYELDVLKHPEDSTDMRSRRMPRHLLDWSHEVPVQAQDAPSRPLDSATRLRVAKQYIQDHLAQRISILEVATICGVSPRTLTQDFHAAEGRTPLEYINAVKVEQAVEWLNQGRSIREVASAVGFETVLGFVKAYVRVHGQPPPNTGEG